jgi:hypothetical protein
LKAIIVVSPVTYVDEEEQLVYRQRIWLTGGADEM